MKPITDKTVAKTPARGARTKGAFPFYKAIGNAKRVCTTFDVCDRIPQKYRGRVYLDFGDDGELIGVKIMG